MFLKILSIRFVHATWLVYCTIEGTEGIVYSWNSWFLPVVLYRMRAILKESFGLLVPVCWGLLLPFGEGLWNCRLVERRAWKSKWIWRRMQVLTKQRPWKVFAWQKRQQKAMKQGCDRANCPFFLDLRFFPVFLVHFQASQMFNPKAITELSEVNASCEKYGNNPPGSTHPQLLLLPLPTKWLFHSLDVYRLFSLHWNHIFKERIWHYTPQAGFTISPHLSRSFISRRNSCLRH